MADIRIKDIARTVIAPKISEFVETDHSTDGSGKLDLGAWLAARRNGHAPRQAIAFCGSAKAATTITTAKTLAFAFRADANSDILSFSQWSIGGNFRLSVQAGLLRFEPNSPYENVNVAPVTFGEWNHVVIVGVAGAPVLIYVNGLLTAQTSNNIINDLIGTALTLGADHTGVASLVGSLTLIGVYNRALSAAEILTSYKNGAPDASDYNSASSVAINTAAVTNHVHSSFDYDTVTGASATGFSATYAGSNSGAYAVINPQVVGIRGQRFLVTFDATINSGTAPKLAFGVATVFTGLAPASNIHDVIAGANSVILELTSSTFDQLYVYNAAGENADYSLANISLVRLGLLCAPEVDAPGCGPQWRDASGNGVVINLPTDGASNGALWRLPSTQGGRFTTTRTSSGYLIADQVVIPANCKLVAIEIIGNGTFTLGESAGTPANVIASTTATATSQRLTPLVRTTSNRKLYAALGTATSLTVTPIFEVVS